MRLLRRHCLWVALAAMAGLAGALLAGAGGQAQYASAAEVDVEAHVFANTVPVVPNMATERDVATSGLVLASAAPLLGLAPADLAKHVGATVSASTSILSIVCTMPEAAPAQRCAAAVSRAYLRFRNDAGSPAAVQEHNAIQATLVTAAPLPDSPSGTREPILLAVGAILGLSLGAGAVFVRDRADDRVRDRADLERCLNAPALAAVPRVRRRSSPPASVFLGAPLSPAAEAYRYLRLRLDPLLASAAGSGRVVLVTGARAGEGRTCVASNLAAALARAGAEVLLVDADLRHPALSDVFGVDDQPGLTDILAGTASLSDVIASTQVPRLRLVTAGGHTDRPADTFELSRLNRAFESMTAAADIVVVDSGPVLAVSDPIALAFASDIVMVVADVRRTSRADVRAVADEIRAAWARPIVGVLNRGS